MVAATIAAATSPHDPGTVCNVAGGAEVSVNELIPLLAEVTGREIEVAHEPAQPGDVDRTGGSIDRARALLSWEPEVALAEGLTAQYAEINSAS